MALCVLAIPTWFVLAMFPAQLAAGDGVIDVLAHYAGFVYGAVIAVWGYRYWGRPR